VSHHSDESVLEIQFLYSLFQHSRRPSPSLSELLHAVHMFSLSSYLNSIAPCGPPAGRVEQVS